MFLGHDYLDSQDRNETVQYIEPQKIPSAVL